MFSSCLALLEVASWRNVLIKFVLQFLLEKKSCSLNNQKFGQPWLYFGDKQRNGWLYFVEKLHGHDYKIIQSIFREITTKQTWFKNNKESSSSVTDDQKKSMRHFISFVLNVSSDNVVYTWMTELICIISSN